MDNDDNIRPPDNVVSDQLLEDNRSDYEKQMDEALYLSYQEMKEKDEIHRKYEELLIKEYNEEKDKRTQQFTKFLLDVKKVGMIDKEIRDICEIIEPIIELYCNQHINVCEIDKSSCEKIFRLLNTIRTDKSAVDLLKIIIIHV
jgi:hypothetical protein